MRCGESGKELENPESVKRSIGPLCLAHILEEGRQQLLADDILESDMEAAH
ncbi:hypothetical protein ApAK_07270 [Thermoplasmatales archaeon AK]|nr:hypothetical protein [Thermoplasmatales archaeon AK]